MANETALNRRDRTGYWRLLDEHRELLTICGVLLVIAAIAAFSEPNFRTSRNLFNVLRQAVALGLVSIGQTATILVGGIDLSVGATISLVGVYTTGFMAKYTSPAAVAGIVLAMIALSLAIGGANSLVITRLRVPAFIATMGVGAIVQGLVLLYAKRPGGGIAPGWEFFAEGMIGPVPFPVLLLLFFLVLSAFYLRRTVMGRHLIATGGSEVIARLSGIITWRVITFAYMFSSLMAALSGLFLTSRMGAGDPLMGGLNYDRYDLDSITAVLIGGTRLGGGKGGVLGTIVGVVIVCVLNNIFNLTGLNPYVQWIIKGLIFIAAVAVYSAREPGDRR